MLLNKVDPSPSKAVYNSHKYMTCLIQTNPGQIGYLSFGTELVVGWEVVSFLGLKENESSPKFCAVWTVAQDKKTKAQDEALPSSIPVFSKEDSLTESGFPSRWRLKVA